MRRQLGLAYLMGARIFAGRFGSVPPTESASTGPNGEGRPRLLVVSPYSIYPLIHGGAARIYNLIRRLSERAEVSVFIFGGGTDDPVQRAALEPFCRRVFFQLYPEPEAARDPWHLLPPSAARYASPAVTERLRAIVAAHRIDAVILEYTEMGQFAGPYPRARVVLVEHDLSFRSHARQRSVGIDSSYAASEVLGRGYGDWLRRYHFELAACQAAHQIHVMSSEDEQTLAPLLADGDRRIRVIPNGVDTDHFHPPPDDRDRTGALFVGSFPHLPNQDAFDYLVSEVWPLVRQSRSDARLTVAGARPPQRVLDLDGTDGITVAGEVPDLAPLYQSHRLLAVPIRAGSGTRLKILEAMSCGLPVVSTTIGAEGIQCRPDHDIVVADDPTVMAEAIAALLGEDCDRGRTLAANGRRLVAERYDWNRIVTRLETALAEITPAPVPALKTTGPDDDSTRPPVSVIIRVGESADLERCLEGVIGQQSDRPFELLAVLSPGVETDAELLSRYAARVVGPIGPDRAEGWANAAATAARGDLLVFIDAAATPADRRWLELLLAPFDEKKAPAAVQGGLHVQFEPGGPPFDPFFTAETQRWRRAHGGFAFSLANAAVDRSAWERFPFASENAVDRRWQRQVAANRLLVLPCWEAAVHWTRPLEPRSALVAAHGEGRAWRRLEVRYGLTDLLRDLANPHRGRAESPEASPTPTGMTTRAHRLYHLIRPIGLFVGNKVRD